MMSKGGLKDFLSSKKADLYALIALKISKLKVFPVDQSLISNMTAEEKVESIRESLRNPQLVVLSKYVSHKNNKTFAPSHLSPVSRRKMNQEPRNNGQEFRRSGDSSEERDLIGVTGNVTIDT
jgi:hypothetical protein